MEDQSRARFEEWILKKAKDLNYSYMDMVLKRFENGDYRTAWVDMACMGWQACLESLVIELPNPLKDLDISDRDITGMCAQFRKDEQAIEVAGLKVKS